MEATSLVGIPWRERGRDRRGCDCWGLVHLAYRDIFRLDLPSFTDADPGDVEQIASMVAGESRGGPWSSVEPRQATLGDVAVFRTDAALPTHVGLAMGSYRMLHIRRDALSEMASFNPDSWRGRLWSGRLAGVYRHAEVPR